MTVEASPGQSESFDSGVVQATAHFKAQRFEDALRVFRSLRSSATDDSARLRLQWNIARSLEELGRYPEALPIFEDYAKAVEDPVRSSRAQAKIEALSPKVYGVISVSCVGGSSAKVTLEKHGTTIPCPGVFERVAPGLWVVIAEGEKLDRQRQVVTVKAGQTSPATITFKNMTAPPPAQVAQKRVWPWYVGGAVLLATGAVTAWALSQDDPAPVHRGRLCLENGCD